MSSSIHWLDFSDADRRKMIEIVSLFKQRDTRDELGLALIRDRFADMFFPGTTTLQTRARYFLFIPWIYRYYEIRRTSSSVIAKRIQKQEIRLMRALAESNDTDGIIGQRSGPNLQRFPSSIYWNGLRVWGILHFPGLQHQYHRSLDRYYQYIRSLPDTESRELVNDIHPNWDPGLPNPPKNFPQEASFQLTYEDAQYLRERLLVSCPNTLMTHLVDRCEPVEDVPFAWLHPQFAEFPTDLKDRLTHARNFSETMQGAALLYNLMLAEKRASDKLISRYRDRLHGWFKRMQQREPHLLAWKRDAFWQLTDEFSPVSYPTRSFVNRWLDNLLTDPGIRDPVDDPVMRQLVHNREVWLKRGRSRLENPRHLELWGGESGTAQLNFRWGVGNRLARDIQFGLKQEVP